MQKYSEAQNEIMTLRRERIEQDDVIEKLKNEVESLKRKNEQLNRKLNELQRKLNKLIGGDVGEE